MNSNSLSTEIKRSSGLSRTSFFVVLFSKLRTGFYVFLLASSPNFPINSPLPKGLLTLFVFILASFRAKRRTQSVYHSRGPSIAFALSKMTTYYQIMSDTQTVFKNLAIIAHVDHGKTSLVDQLLTASGTMEHLD